MGGSRGDVSVLVGRKELRKGDFKEVKREFDGTYQHNNRERC
jgi:hypothetical protein